MLKKLLSLFKNHDERFPKEIKEHWSCGVWYMTRSKLHDKGEEYRAAHVQWPIEGEVFFSPFECGLVGNNGDDSRLIDGLIPAIRVGNLIGLYEVTSVHGPRAFYDGASWDDGKKVDLRFVKTVESK